MSRGETELTVPIVGYFVQYACVLVVAISLGRIDPAAADTQGHALGSPQARVILIEYASMTCDNCAAFHRSILPEIRKRYIDSGLVRFVYNDFPLDGTALKAALLPHCVGSERYFDAVEETYRMSAQWIRPASTLGALIAIGEQLGASRESIAACLQDPTVQDMVLNSRLDAQRDHKVKGTPTFVFNGEVIEGLLTLDAMSRRLDALLGKM